jgi:uncharacterized protein
MTRVQYAPGLYYETVAPAVEPSPLRSDVAGFIGRTRRGPVGKAIRVTGWREYLIAFGGLAAGAGTPHAIRGYFENGGDVAYVIRLFGAAPSGDPGGIVASAVWDLTAPGSGLSWAGWHPSQARFTVSKILVHASSPGAWANGLRVKARYRRDGASGGPEVDLVVHAADEPAEHLIGLDPLHIFDQVADRSQLIRLKPGSPAAASSVSGKGPRALEWEEIVFNNVTDVAVSGADYLAGVDRLAEEAEVALVAMPDLVCDIGPEPALRIQQSAVAQADALHDRLVLIDLPAPHLASSDVIAWADQFRKSDLQDALRAAIAYYPWLSIQDPLGGTASPLRDVPPCGHVAGLISRYDRERGAHYTAANATLEGVIDIAASYSLGERAALNETGVNVVRCMPGRGIQVWGGRTLHPDTRLMFIAHRRLIHRLVRAIRHVAEALVFETNGPVLWLTLARAATTVLAEAHRAGGLKGERPEHAFRVRCDETTNPEEERDLGRVLCEIDLAPAVPMEFITLRVALSAAGQLDVFEK